MTTPTDSDPMPVSGNTQPTAIAGSGAFTPEHFAKLVLRVLDEEGAEAAAALMRGMLSADQGILLERTSGDVRRELLPWLTLDEISDILDEAPTESAVSSPGSCRPNGPLICSTTLIPTPWPTFFKSCPNSRLRQLWRNWIALRMWSRYCSIRRILPAA